MVTTTASTSSLVIYMCTLMVTAQNQAETIQAMVAAFVAAASLMYIA